MDYYKILGINKTATQDEIKKAFRKKAKDLHPDKNNGKTSKEFNDVNLAYETLSDTKKRHEYDNPMSGGGFGNFSGFGNFGFDIDELIRNMRGSSFGANFYNYTSDYSNRVQDAKIMLKVTFEEMYHGFKKTARINVQDENGKTVQTTVTLEKPPYILVRTMNYKGCGNYINKTDRTNLIVQVLITNDEKYSLFEYSRALSRNGEINIKTSIEVPFHVLCKGQKNYQIDFLGEKINIDIPSGCEIGTIIKIKNQALISPITHMRGDVAFSINMKKYNYTKMSTQMKKLIDELGIIDK